MQRRKESPLRKQQLPNTEQTRKPRRLYSKRDLLHGRKPRHKDYHFHYFQELLRKSLFQNLFHQIQSKRPRKMQLKGRLMLFLNKWKPPLLQRNKPQLLLK